MSEQNLLDFMYDRFQDEFARKSSRIDGPKTVDFIAFFKLWLSDNRIRTCIVDANGQVFHLGDNLCR